MRKRFSAAGIVIAVVIDQLLKKWAQSFLGGGRVLKWGGVVALRYVRNTGAAFSLFSSHTVLLSVCTGLLLAAGLVLLFSRKIRNALLRTALTLVLAGGIGNWIDRVRFGFVTDYIDPLFVRFAVFNFADILITVGAALLVAWVIADTVRGRTEKKETP